MSSGAQSPLKPTLLWVLLLVVIVFVLNRGVLLALDRLLPDDDLWAKIRVILHQSLAILLPVLVFISLQRARFRDAVGLYKPSWWRAAVAVVGGVGVILAVNSLLPRLIPPTPSYSARTGSIVAYDSLPELLLVVVAVSVLAPAADELFLRGVVLRGVMARYGPVVAVLATALLTSAFHTLEPFKLTHAFIMGVVFASAVVWSGSVWTSLILHALHNSLSLLPQG